MKEPLRILLYSDVVQRWALSYERVQELAEIHSDFPKPAMVLPNGNIPLYLEKDIIEYEKRHQELLHICFRGRSIRTFFYQLEN
ncbi:hypothetical protein [Ectobacillus panaciterrae]|uniref:hypothetical protein n=1 Tax=Ectobacillus panaciterrae TaxID=363872 RepID=UPI00048C3AE4|nr:hypothetical protein [Ectobacillus panaciterrae]